MALRKIEPRRHVQSEGEVVQVILEAAEGTDLIVMATEGRHGIFDALRGSVTERVAPEAPAPFGRTGGMTKFSLWQGGWPAAPASNHFTIVQLRRCPLVAVPYWTKVQ